ncbi:hypothetical protein PPYR_11262 [Photinus pyralis]|uniref:G-protein coupled receptors family 1 profile domain-containing protein n=1 Tax=Photinus pyralis TaxID=7054 RepID=A0A1Y1LKH0_PHOPY|nr:probable G-protein coupled receptor AH9.1 [Photinus pyralis]KAB0794423.1 hypothetical protein PPYR_11262 [Photinus pyralis]
MGVPKCNNQLSSLDEFEVSTKDLRRIAYTIIAPGLIVVGIFGNVLNLLVLSKPFFNNCTRIYLRALAIADVSILLFDISMVLRLSDSIGHSFYTAVFFAYIEMPLLTTFIAFSVYIITCLTIDRYISVCSPTTFNSFHTCKMAKGAILVCMGIAVLFASPLYLLKTTCWTEICQLSFMDNVTVTDTTYWRTYIIVSELMMRMGPAFVVAILNILIIKKLKALKKLRHKYSPSLKYNKDDGLANYTNKNKKYKDEQQLITLLQMISLLFLITITPASFLSIWYTFRDDNSLGFERFRTAANLLEMANFALNFFAYFLCSREFRKALANVFQKVINYKCYRENFCKRNNQQIAIIIENF